ncbi:GDP-mannose mannosyl hydrolase [Achromobacter deleyi]|uniref:GDP-mannose mannosyl hydrolase n=1 Tax=Achromobacter deleyi TaxID=1353891 RepID=A0A6S7AQM1_9BURK|nr:GDP-mannose mannosyl hydrolase [Achromobacter deleyi]CAB3739637.1 GDP-mannose mannosyl hydrolase [Achromobacter deleyi]CAB3920786.1 GDP-mannose mannosyl hydrolase [Achromobacter deleyi]CAB3926335.1 GDP-mannose mannosyl hydrolase [Achromobacter deleyi]
MSTEPLGWPALAGVRARPAPRPAPATPGLLPEDDFRRAVQMLPLVSIDLLLRDPAGRYLTGLRCNPPAQGAWFVPGGRVRKDETLAQALRRLAREELGLTLPPQAWRPRGVYEHFYGTNFAGENGRSTHYIVLAYEAQLALDTASLPLGQHRRYRWQPPAAIAADPGAHPYTQAYFKESAP